MTRRARQGNVRKRTSASTSLRRTSKHPSVRPAAPDADEDSELALSEDEVTPRLPRSTTDATEATPGVGRRASERASERPVAHSLKPEARASESREPKPLPWFYLVAAAALAGVLWIAFGNSGKKSGNPDETAGKPDTASPALVEPAAVAAQPSPERVATPEPPDTIIELDEPEVERATPVVQRRVLSAKPPKKPLPSEPEPAAQGPFDREAANAALSDAATQASACRQDGDPTGVAKVVVTFAPSGRVTSATINGPPFAGTPTGSCIAKTLRAMSVTPFQGDLMTISKTVVIM